MEIQSSREEKVRLPVISARTPQIGTRHLQQMTSKDLDLLEEEGPRIVCINNMKKGVLVGFEQFERMQQRFNEMANMLLRSLCILKPNIPQGTEVESLRIQIDLTLRQVREEMDESSPFADYMDTLITLGSLLNTEVEGVDELRSATKKALNKNSSKIEGKSRGFSRRAHQD